jgi:hypothetical protein
MWQCSCRSHTLLPAKPLLVLPCGSQFHCESAGMELLNYCCGESYQILYLEQVWLHVVVLKPSWHILLHLWEIHDTEMMTEHYRLCQECIFSYFGMKLGHQDKDWALHKVCWTCVGSLRLWKARKKISLFFSILIVWREPRNHTNDFFFLHFIFFMGDYPASGYYLKTNVSGLLSVPSSGDRQ